MPGKGSIHVGKFEVKTRNDRNFVYDSDHCSPLVFWGTSEEGLADTILENLVQPGVAPFSEMDPYTWTAGFWWGVNKLSSIQWPLRLRLWLLAPPIPLLDGSFASTYF